MGDSADLQALRDELDRGLEACHRGDPPAADPLVVPRWRLRRQVLRARWDDENGALARNLPVRLTDADRAAIRRDFAKLSGRSPRTP